MDLSAFHNQFREETVENVRVLNEGLLALEAAGDDQRARAHVDAIFRAVHTIKGSARLLGFATVGKLAHVMEHFLDEVREGRRQLNRALADELLHGGDAILELTTAVIDNVQTTIDVDQLIDRLNREAGVSSAASPAPHEPRPPAVAAPAADESPASSAPGPAPARPVRPQATRASSARQTVRVRVDRLDKLLNLAGELRVGHQVLTNHTQLLHALHTLTRQQERLLSALDAELHRLRFSPTQRQSLEHHLNALHDCTDRTSSLLDQQIEHFNEHLGHHDLLVNDLEQEVMGVRLLPIATLFAAIPRAVRDLTNATGKAVSLDVRGETTELDRKLLEALSDPLLHLIRNAVDHGIEPPEERIALGKPREGRVGLSAEATGGEVRICISDDGRGMDPQKLRATAVRKQLIGAEQAALLTDQEALELIFLPGFTTTALITDISGRGVGMDVVRTNIQELGGEVLIEAQPGRGTTITLILPLTLVTTRILLVNIGDATFALPASGCRGTIWVYQHHVHMIEGQATITHEGRTTPLVYLADLLGTASTPAFHNQARMPVVLIGTAQRSLGLLVDQLLDEREAVIKPLGPLLEALCKSNAASFPYSGAVQPGDGSLMLMLNPSSLMLAARGASLPNPAQRPPSSQHLHLLIADDSFATRELMRSILQAAGYTVTAAIDGLDALDKLKTYSYDLLLSDVEMPRVDGFQLTERIRRDMGNTTMPVIIMTSLASEDHRRRGLEAGAQAYIVKSQFNQDSLLEIIQQLLGNEVTHSI